MARQRFIIKRVNGDGYYDWALLDNGRVIKGGMAKWEAEWSRDARRRREGEEG